MRRTALLALFLAVPAVTAQEAPPAGVTVRDLDGGRLVEVVLPGKVVSSVPAAPAGGDGLLLLIGGDGDPAPWRAVVHLALEDGGALTTVAGDLPERSDAVATVDVDGDGRCEVLIGEPGKVYSLGPLSGSGRPVLVVDSPGLDLAAAVAGGLLEALRPRLVVPKVGLLELYEPDPTSGRMALAATWELPIQTRHRRRELVLSTPAVVALWPEGAGEPLWAVGPQTLSARRLRTVLIDPAREASDQAFDAFSFLPEPETVQSSWYVLIDGRPALVVMTRSTEKLGIFARRPLRVFPLRMDRTRAGGQASLKGQAPSRFWQEADAVVAEATGDRHDDLAVVGPAGMGEGKLRVDVYEGKGGGWFLPTSRESEVDVSDAVWHYGADLSGDGIPDLLTRSGNRLEVFAGIYDRKKKRVLATDARWSLGLPERVPQAGPEKEGETTVTVSVGPEGVGAEVDEKKAQRLRFRGRPEVRDLNGDGRPEIIVAGTYKGGGGVLLVIHLP